MKGLWVLMIALVLHASIGLLGCWAEDGQLLDGLKSDNEEILQATMTKLAAQKSEGFKLAVQYLKDESNPNRLFVLSSLVLFQNDGTMDAVKSYLKSKDEDERAAATLALGGQRNRAVEKELTSALKDKSLKVRGAALKAFAYHKSDLGKEKILEVLKDEKNPSRPQAAEAIGILQEVTSDTLGLLIYALRGQDPAMKCAAAFALGETRQVAAATELANTLKDSDEQVRAAAIAAFVNLGEPGVNTLGSLAKIGDEQQKIAAALILGRIKADKGIDYLMEMLTDPSAAVRFEAINSLVLIGSTKPLPRITALTHDSDPKVKLKAVMALETLGGDSGLSVFISALRDEQADIRLAAIEILNRLKKQESLYHIKENITDQDPTVAQRVKDLLTKDYAAVAGPDIEELLRSPTKEKILAALEVARTLKLSAEDKVLALLTHPEPEIRYAAIDHLKDFGSMAAAEHLDKKYYRSKTEEANKADDASRQIKYRITGVMPAKVKIDDDDY